MIQWIVTGTGERIVASSVSVQMDPLICDSEEQSRKIQSQFCPKMIHNSGGVHFTC